MSKKRPIKENNFDTAQAGVAGAISVNPGWGTFASPDVSQNPGSFAGGKSLGSNSNTSQDMPASGSQWNAELDKIYSKADTPSVDEVITGLKYELHHMIKKDKSKAKEVVLNNLKQDPHYYGKLHMLNIDDEEMMETDPTKKTQDDPIQERIRVLDEMKAQKIKRAETPQSFKEALQQTRDDRARRMKG